MTETEAEDRPREGSFPIVGVGASAGGLEAFTTLLQELAPHTGMALVLVQHLDPQHESALTQLLGRVSSLPVQEITQDLPVEPDHVYVIPPNTTLFIAQGIARPIIDRKEDRILLVIEDVTERGWRKSLEQSLARLGEHADELARFNRLAVGREVRMIELKKEVNELCAERGEAARYAIEFEKPRAAGAPDGNGPAEGGRDGEG